MVKSVLYFLDMIVSYQLVYLQLLTQILKIRFIKHDLAIKIKLRFK